MTLVVFQYPPVIIVFALCALFAVCIRLIRKTGHMHFLIMGLLTIALILLSLMFSIPLEELVFMLLIPAIVLCLPSRKEGSA